MLANIFNKIDSNKLLSKKEIIYLLKVKDAELKSLYKKADQIRRDCVGDNIYLRGIIEFSNHCKKNCNYCGIRREVTNLNRYRIKDNEIIKICKQIEKNKQTTVVLQSGEDSFYTKEKIGDLIRKIKKETALAVTLSVGVRDAETYKHWQDFGMDRYLIRFETSNGHIFKQCHPDDGLHNRLDAIYALKSLGVQIGSGFLIGLPGDTHNTLADNILFCSELNLDMIGIGPFITNSKTPFGAVKNTLPKELFFKTIAILRMLNKNAHIPATTAYDAIDNNGRNLVLQRGSNVFMPNATPKKYRGDYLLYPNKPCVDESTSDCARCVMYRISSLGRKLGFGPGHSLRKS